MTSTNSSKVCKSCGNYRQVEDNKCTVCNAEYSDGGLLKKIKKRFVYYVGHFYPNIVLDSPYHFIVL